VSLVIFTPSLTMTWHMSDSVPMLFAMARENITSISAKGEELEYIRNHFDNLPIPNHRDVVFWYGETAKFIVANFRATGDIQESLLQKSINENNETETTKNNHAR